MNKMPMRYKLYLTVIAFFFIIPICYGEQTILIDKPLLINKAMDYSNLNLIISENGRIDIAINGILKIQNCKIFLILDTNKPQDQKIVQYGGLLSIENSVLTASASTTNFVRSDNLSQYSVISYEGSNKDTRKTELMNNKLTATTPNAITLLLASLKTDTASDQYTKNIYKTNIKIFKNNVTGFHGAFIADGVTSFSAINNYMYKNTFVQFGLSGKNITITDNHLVYPGNGQTGDGITFINRAENVVISRNIIENGSCYGIHFNADTIFNVIISKNIIRDGTTVAIYMSANNVNKWEKITIIQNTIENNLGVSLASKYSIGLSVINNYFGNNFNDFDFPVIIGFGPPLHSINNTFKTNQKNANSYFVYTGSDW